MTSATSLRAEADHGSVAVRRGLTLLEILVVISIVLAAGAIVVPFTFRELERRQAAFLEDRLSMLVQFARVESRRSGVPVEVLIDADGRGVEAMRLDVDRLDEGLTPASGLLGDMIVDEAAVDADDPRRFASVWARHDLEDGRLIPPATVEDAAAFAADDPFASLEFEPDDGESLRFDDPDELDDLEDPWPGPVRLAVFFPDGTSVTTTPAVLESSRGDRRWTIDPWSGRSTFEFGAATAAGDSDPFDDAARDMDDMDDPERPGDGAEPDDFGTLGSGDGLEAGDQR